VSPVRYELWLYIPEDDILHSHRRENLKSYIITSCWQQLDLHASYNDTFHILVSGSEISNLALFVTSSKTFQLSSLWSSGQNFLATNRKIPGLISDDTTIFCCVVGPKPGPLSLVRIIEELLEGNNSGSGIELRK
jgi:hypothetical protein